jgi:uncharacterized protein
MADMPADNRWKVFLATDDMTKTLDVADANGGQVVVPAIDIADLGRQAVLIDSAGARVGTWQAGTFPGFTVLNEHGAPSWFELHTRDHAGSVNFYRTVFGWETDVEGDTDEFRYTTLRDPEGEGVLAGIMDGARFMLADEPNCWYVYWEVDDAAAATVRATGLGASVVSDAQDTPYGQLAALIDPTGARFNLRTSPR